MLTDVQACASALYDGGWRSEDRDDIIDLYNLSEDDADAVCDLLKDYAKYDDNLLGGVSYGV